MRVLAYVAAFRGSLPMRGSDSRDGMPASSIRTELPQPSTCACASEKHPDSGGEHHPIIPRNTAAGALCAKAAESADGNLYTEARARKETGSGRASDLIRINLAVDRMNSGREVPKSLFDT